MLKIRYVFIVLGMLLCSVASAAVQVSIGIGLPNVSIGINVPVYPELVVVPGYPVYYAPRLEANFFFYDGMYWVYRDDYWYSSSWYNGPWWVVGPEVVPLFILRIPVYYYRQPPTYFLGWRSDAPPRWGEHWGGDWQQRRSGWDSWNRSAVPAAAPLPVYQRQYSGDRYPQQVEQQRELHQQNYRYQPRDPVVRQQYQEQEKAVQKAPAQQGKTQQETPGTPGDRGSKQQDNQRSAPPQQATPAAPRSQSPQKGSADVQRSTPASPQQGRPQVQDRKQQPQPELDQGEQQMPESQGQDATPEPKRGQGQGQQQRGRDRNE